MFCGLERCFARLNNRQFCSPWKRHIFVGCSLKWPRPVIIGTCLRCSCLSLVRDSVRARSLDGHFSARRMLPSSMLLFPGSLVDCVRICRTTDTTRGFEFTKCVIYCSSFGKDVSLLNGQMSWHTPRLPAPSCDTIALLKSA